MPAQDDLGSDIKDSLVSEAAPIAGRSDQEQRGGPGNRAATDDRPGSYTAGLGAGAGKPWGGILARSHSRLRREDPEDTAAGAGTHIRGDEDDARNCAVQRLHNRLRLHNSTDPRPKAGAASAGESGSAGSPGPVEHDRGSVLSVSSCGSRCSHGSSRFSFGLDLFKCCENKHGNAGGGGGRGSGWSLWFRQDDGHKSSNELATSSPVQEKQQSA